MAINLLIDTSNLIRLLNALEEDRNLHKLSVWLDLQEIRLHVPDILLQEWEEHKVKKLNEIGEIVKKIVITQPHCGTVKDTLKEILQCMKR